MHLAVGAARPPRNLNSDSPVKNGVQRKERDGSLAGGVLRLGVNDTAMLGRVWKTWHRHECSQRWQSHILGRVF